MAALVLGVWGWGCPLLLLLLLLPAAAVMERAVV